MAFADTCGAAADAASEPFAHSPRTNLCRRYCLDLALESRVAGFCRTINAILPRLRRWHSQWRKLATPNQSAPPATPAKAALPEAASGPILTFASLWGKLRRKCQNLKDHWKYMFLVDFTILTFADPSQPPGDANVKINPPDRKPVRRHCQAAALLTQDNRPIIHVNCARSRKAGSSGIQNARQSCPGSDGHKTAASARRSADRVDDRHGGNAVGKAGRSDRARCRRACDRRSQGPA